MPIFKTKFERGIAMTDKDVAIAACKELDYNREFGRVFPYYPMQVIKSDADTDLSELRTVDWFRKFTVNDKYYALSKVGTTNAINLFSSTDLASWTRETGITDLGQSATGMGEYKLYLYIRGTSAILRYDGTTWTNSWQSGLKTPRSGFAPIEEFAGNVYFGNDDTLSEFDNTTFTAEKIVLPPEFSIKCLAAGESFIYIGTINTIGREAKIFYWDSGSTNYNGAIPVGTNRVDGMTAADGVVYAYTNDGKILKISTAGISELYQTKNLTLGSPDGIKFLNGELLLNLKAITNNYTGYSGVYAYNVALKSFYHKASPTLTTSGMTIDRGQNEVSTAGAIYVVGAGSSPEFISSNELYLSYSGTLRRALMQPNTNGAANAIIISGKLYNDNALTKLWQFITLAFKKLSSTSASIVVKYSLEEPYIASRAFSWVSSTVLNIANTAGLSVGDEVEILAGYSAGQTRHIASIVADTSITVDEAFSSSGASEGAGGIARFLKFKKLGTVSETDLTSTSKKILHFLTRKKRSEFIILKIEIRSYKGEPAIDLLQLNFNQAGL